MREYYKPNNTTVFLSLIICVLVSFSAAQADLLVGTDGPPGDGQVRRFSNDGTFIGDFISGGPELDEPTAVVFGPDGNLYVLTGSDTVVRYNGSTGAFIDIFIPTNSNGLDEAKDMIFGPDGNLYIASNCFNGGDGPDCPPDVVGEGGRVMRFNGQTGAFIDDFIPNGAGGSGSDRLSEAMSIIFGPDGKFYVGNDPRCVNDPTCESIVLGDNVLRFNGTTGAYIDTPFPANFMGLYDPNGMTIGPDCNLYISSEGASFTFDGIGIDNPNVIFRFNILSGVIDEFVPSNGLLDQNGPFPPGTGLIEPEKIVFGPNGNLYVTSGDTTELFVYNGDSGGFVSFFSSIGDDPKGITFFPGESPVCNLQLRRPIPTLGEWGLVITAGLLVFLSLIALRKRMSKSAIS